MITEIRISELTEEPSGTSGFSFPAPVLSGSDDTCLNQHLLSFWSLESMTPIPTSQRGLAYWHISATVLEKGPHDLIPFQIQIAITQNLGL